MVRSVSLQSFNTQWLAEKEDSIFSNFAELAVAC